MKLWTLTVDYAATGEGMTLIAFVTYAKDEDQLERKFVLEFGEGYDFYLNGATIKEGFDKNNNVVKLLASRRQIDMLERAVSNANIVWADSFHLNYS